MFENTAGLHFAAQNKWSSSHLFHSKDLNEHFIWLWSKACLGIQDVARIAWIYAQSAAAVIGDKAPSPRAERVSKSWICAYGWKKKNKTLHCKLKSLMKFRHLFVLDMFQMNLFGAEGENLVATYS